ncbi:MAG: hypothetical protein Q8O55_07855 [Dehalococcoidales bacterium]|nr:hypothetical protein [Dehalococcoidales bacterium]
MHLYWRNKNGARRLPKPIQEYMRRRFGLLPQYLELLRCFEYDGQVKDKQVRRVSIFSPAKAREKDLSIRSRQDLEQHHELLFYEGYIDSAGDAYVADRRTPRVEIKAT